MEWYEWIVCIVLVFAIDGKSKNADFNFVLTIAIGMILWNN